MRDIRGPLCGNVRLPGRKVLVYTAVSPYTLAVTKDPRLEQYFKDRLAGLPAQLPPEDTHDTK